VPPGGSAREGGGGGGQAALPTHLDLACQVADTWIFLHALQALQLLELLLQVLLLLLRLLQLCVQLWWHPERGGGVSRAARGCLPPSLSCASCSAASHAHTACMHACIQVHLQALCCISVPPFLQLALPAGAEAGAFAWRSIPRNLRPHAAARCRRGAWLPSMHSRGVHHGFGVRVCAPSAPREGQAPGSILRLPGAGQRAVRACIAAAYTVRRPSALQKSHQSRAVKLGRPRSEGEPRKPDCKAGLTDASDF
jgi:hypothetical protein